MTRTDELALIAVFATLRGITLVPPAFVAATRQAELPRKEERRRMGLTSQAIDLPWRERGRLVAAANRRRRCG
jgi:hypothetical protein